jgi:hypothetical protein
MDRDRAFYCVVAIVVAHYYVLFAIVGASTPVLIQELLGGTIFFAAAVWGFRSSLWLVAAALAGHGLFDLIHGRVISNPGLPPFWPAFCSAFDVVIALYLGWMLQSGRVRARG